MIKKLSPKSVVYESLQRTESNLEELKKFVGQENVSFLPEIENSFLIMREKGDKEVKVGDYVVHYGNGNFSVFSESLFELLFTEAE